MATTLIRVVAVVVLLVVIATFSAEGQLSREEKRRLRRQRNRLIERATALELQITDLGCTPSSWQAPPKRSNLQDQVDAWTQRVADLEAELAACSARTTTTTEPPPVDTTTPPC